MKSPGRARAGKKQGKISSRGSEGPKPAFHGKRRAESNSTAGKLFLSPSTSGIKPQKKLLEGQIAKISPEKVWEMEEGEASALLEEAELPLGFVYGVQAGLEPLGLANSAFFAPNLERWQTPSPTLPVIRLGKLLWI